MRTFIATEVDENILDRVDEVVRAIRDESGIRTPVTWIERESRHLTLQFLGEVSAAAATSIDRTLRGIRFPAFRIHVRGVGFFPRETSARVFWAGVTSEGFSELAREIHGRTSALGFDTPAHPLKPHLTLARAKGGRQLGKAFVDVALGFREHDFGSAMVDRVALIESRLSSTGARYSRIAEYALSD